jgi:hypothetical protein
VSIYKLDFNFCTEHIQKTQYMFQTLSLSLHVEINLVHVSVLNSNNEIIFILLGRLQKMAPRGTAIVTERGSMTDIAAVAGQVRDDHTVAVYPSN